MAKIILSYYISLKLSLFSQRSTRREADHLEQSPEAVLKIKYAAIVASFLVPTTTKIANECDGKHLSCGYGKGKVWQFQCHYETTVMSHWQRLYCIKIGDDVIFVKFGISTLVSFGRVKTDKRRNWHRQVFFI